MSHFVAVVILPKETSLSAALADPAAVVAPLLAPYDENLEVEPYETACVCVGSEARHAASVAAEAAHPSALIRAHFWALPEDERTEACWQALIAPRQRMRDELLASHPRQDQPDPACGFYTAAFCDDDPRKIGQRFADGSGCGGTGRITSTYSQNARWDWWEVGGHWHGAVCGPHDVCRVHEIAVDAECFAIVTPDGAWHERSRMGWFGVTTDAKPAAAWAAIRQSIFAECGPHVAVCCDLHI